MNILGIFAMGDSSACLIKDGKLVNYVEEERFTRRKHSRYYDSKKDRVHVDFPINSIKWCLKDANLNIEDIDFIAHGWLANSKEMEEIYKSCEAYKETNRLEWEKKCLKKHSPEYLKKKIIDKLTEERLFPVPDIEFIPHHLSHAATSFCSGWDECAVLTVDGHGDKNSTCGWLKEGKELKKLFEYPYHNSLGWFYSGVTEFLGFRMKNDETKVMNLANYGNNGFDFDKVVDSERDYYSSDPEYFLYGSHKKSTNPRFSDKFLNQVGENYNSPPKNIENRRGNIALGAQLKLEEILLKLCDKLFEETGLKKLVVSGGIALNCRANARILRETGFEDIFICPPAHDGGTSMGSALYSYSKETGKDPTFRMSNACYGPEYSNVEVEKILSACGVDFEKTEPSTKTAELIKENKVVGWFRGRMEAGPRALGSRSILADASVKSNHERINERYKKSVLWRDRSPTVSEGFSEKHFDSFNSSLDPFMLTLRDVDDSIPAVTSVKGRTRPQVLCENDGLEEYFKLLTVLGEEIGLEAVLNTSYNPTGKAITLSPETAIGDAEEMGLKHIIIEDFYVKL